MQIAVTEPELEAFVQQQVAAGRFRSAEDVLANALSLMRARDHAAGDDLRAAIAVGVGQVDRGEVTPWDPNAIRRESERRLAAERSGGSVG